MVIFSLRLFASIDSKFIRATFRWHELHFGIIEMRHLQAIEQQILIDDGTVFNLHVWSV